MRVRTQAIVCAAAFVVLGAAVSWPERWAKYKAERAAAALKERLTRELPTGATIWRVQAWVVANPMADWSGFDSDSRAAWVLLPGDLGSMLHQPQSLQIWFEFSAGQPAMLEKIEIQPLPFLTYRSEKIGRYPIKWLRALPAIPILWLIFLGVRHSHRLYRGELRRVAGRCPDCNYPMGPSDHCSECGREIASIRPRW